MLQLPLVVTKDSGGEKSLKNATEATSFSKLTLCPVFWRDFCNRRSLTSLVLQLNVTFKGAMNGNFTREETRVSSRV